MSTFPEQCKDVYAAVCACTTTLAIACGCIVSPFAGSITEVYANMK